MTFFESRTHVKEAGLHSRLRSGVDSSTCCGLHATAVVSGEPNKTQGHFLPSLSSAPGHDDKFADKVQLSMCRWTHQQRYGGLAAGRWARLPILLCR